MIQFTGFAVLFILYFSIEWYLKKRTNLKKYGVPEEIKRQYVKIEVPSDKMEILTNSYIETQERTGSPSLLIGDALYDNQRNFSEVKKNASVLVYYHNHQGKHVRLNSETIDLGREQLAGMVQAQKTITVYYESDNILNYYFDLSFLS